MSWLATLRAARGNQLREILHFGVISGMGLILDVAIYSSLVYGLALRPGVSNGVSAFCAITFVFLISGRRQFASTRFSPIKYLIWLAFQGISITTFSALIGWLATRGTNPLLAKALTVPISFLMNFAFMRMLMKPLTKP